MPEVSRFFGISVRMYYDDPNPPHFHAIYGGDEVEVRIEPLAVLRGGLPRRALGMVWNGQRRISRNCSRIGCF